MPVSPQLSEATEIRGADTAKLEVGGGIWSGFTFLPLFRMSLFNPAASDGGHEKNLKMPTEMRE